MLMKKDVRSELFRLAYGGEMIKEVTIKLVNDEDDDFSTLPSEISLIMNAGKYRDAITEITQEARKMIKYQELSDKEHEVISKFRDRVLEIISDLPEF